MPNSKQFCLVFAWLTGLLLAPMLPAQVVFSENFRSSSIVGVEGSDPCTGPAGSGGPGTYLFPVGWRLRNVDNRIPDASVAYINDAWEVRDEFPSQVNNCVAFSTSYYSPFGQANDFMWSPSITIPASGGLLSWRARSYDPNFPDGYEVRIMLASSGPPGGGSGFLGNQISASTVLFSIPAEQAAWVSRSVRLDNFAGQAVHIGFRNNSNDKFILVVDDVRVAAAGPDMAAIFPRPILPYSRVPAAAAYVPALGVSARNNGDMVFTNVIANAQFRRNGVNFGPALASNTLATLGIGGLSLMTWTTPAAPLSELGDWTVQYELRANEPEPPGAQANNRADTPSVNVNATELARHIGEIVGGIGIGAGNGGELGVQFTVPSTITFAGVRFGLNAKPETEDNGAGGTRPSNWAGNNLTANLRSFNTTTNKPGALIATTLAATSVFGARVYDLPFASGPQTLSPGTYVVTINEPILANFPSDASLPLALHLERFQLDTTWVNWPSSPYAGWENFETFGAAYAQTPQISLLTRIDLFKDGFEGVSLRTDNVVAPGSNATRRKPIKKLLFAQPSESK